MNSCRVRPRRSRHHFFSSVRSSTCSRIKMARLAWHCSKAAAISTVLLPFASRRKHHLLAFLQHPNRSEVETLTSSFIIEPAMSASVTIPLPPRPRPHSARSNRPSCSSPRVISPRARPYSARTPVLLEEPHNDVNGMVAIPSSNSLLVANATAMTQADEFLHSWQVEETRFRSTLVYAEASFTEAKG